MQQKLSMLIDREHIMLDFSLPNKVILIFQDKAVKLRYSGDLQEPSEVLRLFLGESIPALSYNYSEWILHSDGKHTQDEYMRARENGRMLMQLFGSILWEELVQDAE